MPWLVLNWYKRFLMSSRKRSLDIICFVGIILSVTTLNQLDHSPRAVLFPQSLRPDNASQHCTTPLLRTMAALPAAPHPAAPRALGHRHFPCADTQTHPTARRRNRAAAGWSVALRLDQGQSQPEGLAEVEESAEWEVCARRGNHAYAFGRGQEHYHVGVGSGVVCSSGKE